MNRKTSRVTKSRRDLLVVGLMIPNVNEQEMEAHKLAISTVQNHNTDDEWRLANCEKTFTDRYLDTPHSVHRSYFIYAR